MVEKLFLPQNILINSLWQTFAMKCMFFVSKNGIKSRERGREQRESLQQHGVLMAWQTVQQVVTMKS